MPKREWCGKLCSACVIHCDAAVGFPCYLDCEAVREDGAIDGAKCIGSTCRMFGFNENQCPVCAAERPDDLDGENGFDGESAHDQWKCLQCGASITSRYELRFARHRLM